MAGRCAAIRSPPHAAHACAYVVCVLVNAISTIIQRSAATASTRTREGIQYPTVPLQYSGVLYSTPSYFEHAYPRWHDFLAVRERLDPHGVFLNEYLRRLFCIERPADPCESPIRPQATMGHRLGRARPRNPPSFFVAGPQATGHYCRPTLPAPRWAMRLRRGKTTHDMCRHTTRHSRMQHHVAFLQLPWQIRQCDESGTDPQLSVAIDIEQAMNDHWHRSAISESGPLPLTQTRSDTCRVRFTVTVTRTISKSVAIII
jgi:hypothetical protein